MEALEVDSTSTCRRIRRA